jgi:hypothetical protein
VIEVFRKAVNAGHPLIVTDPNMTVSGSRSPKP